MISRAYRCIFVHQRKCAGASVIASFDLAPEDPDWHYMNEGVLSPEYHSAPADYFRFSVVRDPYDRFVSGWRYCEGTRGAPLRHLLRNLPRFEHDYVHLTRLQRDVLFDAAGYLAVGTVMRYENLQADYEEVCRTVGKSPVLLPRLNVGGRAGLPAREYFRDPVDRDLFIHHFYRDFEEFGYEP